MSRLTEAELTRLADYFPTHLGEPEVSVLIQRAISELRERRQAELSESDIDALNHARSFVEADLCGEENCDSSACQRNLQSIATIDRLTGRRES